MTTIQKVIERQIHRWNLEQQMRREATAAAETPPLRPWIAIAREMGARSHAVAEVLQRRLGYRIFDREILEAIALTSDFRRAALEGLDERLQSGIALYIDGLLHGRAVDRSDYLRHLLQVVVAIGHHGHAILIGRGAPFILNDRDGLKVRLVASRETRTAIVAADHGLSTSEALRVVRRVDAERIEFVRRFFGVDPRDPSRYDLSLNTGRMEVETAAEVCEVALRKKLASAANVEIEAPPAPQS